MPNTDKSIAPLIVQKYGGATLADPTKIQAVAQRISALRNSGAHVVVVVSAMGQTTNQLIALAHQVSKRPLLRELDMLLSTGERISMSLLSMALNDLGCPAISFTGSQAGILTNDSHINAQIVDLRAHRVEQALEQNKVVILAGFQGVSMQTKEITTLGRGGSDITAVAIAGYLKAKRCEILKDVPGVFTADPKLIPEARLISHLSYNQLFEMTSWGAKVLHSQSVELAAQTKTPLYVGPATAEHSADQGTLITIENPHQKQNRLALNTFARVFKIKFNASFNELQSFLQQNQIGQINFLHRQTLNGDNIFYVTSATEILTALKEFAPNQKNFDLISTDFASVSLTFSLEPSEEDVTTLADGLRKSDISIEAFSTSPLSAHFVISQSQLIEALQILHKLI